MLTRKALANNTVKDTISSTSTAHGLLLPVKFYLDELCSCSSTQAGRHAAKWQAGGLCGHLVRQQVCMAQAV